MKRITDDRLYFETHTDRTGDCWIWTGATRRDGYGVVGLRRYHHMAAHRVSWMIHRGSIPEGLWVLHHCDVRACVNPRHLYLGDRSQNTIDALERHRFKAGDESQARVHPERVPRGERHWAAKLTEDTVRDIRRRAAFGEKQIALQREYGLSSGTVSLVVSRKRWGHVSD